MSPAVTTLLDHIRGLSGPVALEDLIKLQELAMAVEMEDPLTVAFDRAVTGFRKARAR